MVKIKKPSTTSQAFTKPSGHTGIYPISIHSSAVLTKGGLCFGLARSSQLHSVGHGDSEKNEAGFSRPGSFSARAWLHWDGSPKPEPDMIALIHHAINSGITFLDTSDIYGPHTNEILLSKALKGGMREKVELATKFAISFADGKREIRGDPAYVRAACEASLKRLEVDCIDLYYQHRVDTRVPIEVTIGELKKLVEEGKIKYIGLSEASASTIRPAHAVHPITAVQLEWSLWSRDAEKEIVPTCRELGIGIVAYSPLGRGLLSSGPKMVESFSKDDFRQYLPRFQPENLEHNRKLYEHVNEIEAKKGCTSSQLALPWVHHRGDDVCPIPRTTKIENLNQNIKALSVNLTPEDMAELESVATEDAVRGHRYRGTASSYEDSETPPLSSWKAS